MGHKHYGPHRWDCFLKYYSATINVSYIKPYSLMPYYTKKEALLALVTAPARNNRLAVKIGLYGTFTRTRTQTRAWTETWAWTETQAQTWARIRTQARTKTQAWTWTQTQIKIVIEFRHHL
jgi:hypothetical protein